MLEKSLQKLGDDVIRIASANLKRLKKGGGELDKTMKADVKGDSIIFTMAEYWEFVDAGVKGAGGGKSLRKVTNNKFKYTDKKPPFMAFNGWSIKKRIAPRNKKGQFTSRKSILYAIATSVFQRGIATTHFFTDALDEGVLGLEGYVSDEVLLGLIDKISLNNDNITIQ